MRIAVAGGTGLAGRAVVQALQDANHEAVVISRSTGVDVTTGAGLADALVGADVVIDATNVMSLGRAKSEAFFRAGSTNLMAAERDAGVKHHVVLSIVGSDRVDMGYYYGKRVQEAIALNGPIPATVLRATQFHEMSAQLLERASLFGGRIAFVPAMLTQPVAVQEVAAALAAAAQAAPAGLLPDLAGPERITMPDMVRRLVAARGLPTRVISVRLPGRTGRAAATGGLLPSGRGPRGHVTFTEWLSTGGTS